MKCHSGNELEAGLFTRIYIYIYIRIEHWGPFQLA